MNRKRNRLLLGLLLAVLLIGVFAAAAPQTMPDLPSARALLLSVLRTGECQGQPAAVHDGVSQGNLLPACWLSAELVASP
jgi:hypothetical protein